MATARCILFGVKTLARAEVAGKRVLEVGARDVNGSLRPFVESLDPAEYVGVDIERGPGVDRVCRIEDLVGTFGENAFDLVISTETLEHVRDWRAAVSNLKRVCREGGVMLLTTRSFGFVYHGYPHDFWRYEPDDIRAIFSDMEVIELERDAPRAPGVFVKVRKPRTFRERDLLGLRLYSMVERRRILNVDERRLRKFLWLVHRKAQFFRLVDRATGT